MRSFRIAGALALALVVGSQVALGAVPISQHGLRGTWVLIDSETRPAVTCVYDAPGGMGNDLDLMEARSPRVFARDRTGGRDGQWVGVRIMFQRSVNDGGTGGWLNVSQTRFIKKFAHDDKAISIGTRGWQADYTGMPHFRVLSSIRFYRPGTKSVVQGATTLRYQWYETGGASPEMDRCQPEP